MRVLISGGAGFIGSSLTVALADRHPDWDLVAADNLHRRGSELNVPRLEAADARFVETDVRNRADLRRLGDFDAVVEAAAEPTVGADRSPEARAIMVDTNFIGMQNCLERLVARGGHLIALSSSRVYPLTLINAIELGEQTTRLAPARSQRLPGVGPAGISEEFPIEGARTLYGASKLAGELLCQEYAAGYGVGFTTNRCGVIAGPWQMATAEQGVFAHWALCHVLERPLAYVGWGGSGKQVRDLLHVDDLVDLIEAQLLDPDHWSGRTFNVGGGISGSLSLQEASALCADLTGNDLAIASVPATRPGDVAWYVSDCGALFDHSTWRPQRSPRQILADTVDWIRSTGAVAEVL